MTNPLKAYGAFHKDTPQSNTTGQVLERLSAFMQEAAEHIEKNEIEHRFRKTDKVLEVLGYLKAFDYAPQSEEDKRFVEAMFNYYETASYFVTMVNIKNDKTLAEQMAYSFREMAKTWEEMERRTTENSQKP